jgi:hypothetical protein
MCGRDMGYRERVVGEKPRREDRYVYLPDAYCGCANREFYG